MNQKMNTKLKIHNKMHRPFWHYTSKTGWLNDPNGLIYHNDYYHMFYQYYPHGVSHGNMHWGHARSRNLLEWEELSIALYPDENGTVFSGCMVYDIENTSGFGNGKEAPLVAVFTHHLEQEETIIQSQSLAYSLDGGMTFKKYEENPVLDLKRADFRDPKVFYSQHRKQWIMLTVTGREVRFFASENLKNWAYLNTFGAKEIRKDEIWECPDLQEIETEEGGKKWVLFVSQNTLDYSETGVRYFTGSFDGKEFHCESGEEEELLLDFGCDNYAAATYYGEQGRVIQQSWMSCWAYAQKLPEAGFRGSMTFPRELSLRRTSEGYRMIQRPVKEIYEKYPIHKIVSSDSILKINSRIEWIPGIYEIEFPSMVGQVVIRNDLNFIKINMDFQEKIITVDRGGCRCEALGEQFGKVRKMHFISECRRKIQILLDVTSLEIFAGDGEAVGTVQYFVEEPFNTIVTGGII